MHAGAVPAMENAMHFDERNEGDYRIYAGALESPHGGGYVAAVVVNRLGCSIDGLREGPIAIPACRAATAGVRRTTPFAMRSLARRS
jgi:hypothetical protein